MLVFNTNSKRMLITRERTQVEKAVEVPMRLIRNFPTRNWNPPIASELKATYIVPSFTARYEKMLTSKYTTKNNSENLHPLEGKRQPGSVNNFDEFTRRWKPCQHYIRWVVPEPEGSSRYLNWATLSGTSLGSYVQDSNTVVPALLAADSPVFRSKFGSFGDHILGLQSMTEVTANEGFVPKPAGLSVLVEHALKSMTPQMKSDVSLLNTLIELKDFKSLPRTLSNIARVAKLLPLWIKSVSYSKSGQLLAKLDGKEIRLDSKELKKYSLPRRLRRIRQSFGGLGYTLAEMTRAGADGYLQKEFNIEPLLRDICAIYDALVGINRRLQRQIGASGRVHMKHYSFEWQEVATPATEMQSTNAYLLNLGQFAGSITPTGQTGSGRSHPLGWKATRRVTHYHPTQFHAQLEFSYNFTPFQLENTRVLDLLDKLGLYTINPAVIWNAIPWSFLVDWVIGVNRWLANRAVLNMQPTINVSRFLWSWERFRRIAVFVETTSKGYNIPSTIETYLPTMYETTYRRDIGLPVSAQSIWASELDSREFSLGVALAITRRKRITNRGVKPPSSKTARK